MTPTLDITPTDLDRETREIWWRMMETIARFLGPPTFKVWLTKQLGPWKLQGAVIRLLAETEPDSQWSLEMEYILETHKFLEDDEPVKPQDVADSVVDILEEMRGDES